MTTALPIPNPFILIFDVEDPSEVDITQMEYYDLHIPEEEYGEWLSLVPGLPYFPIGKLFATKWPDEDDELHKKVIITFNTEEEKDAWINKVRPSEYVSGEGRDDFFHRVVLAALANPNVNPHNLGRTGLKDLVDDAMDVYDNYYGIE